MAQATIGSLNVILGMDAGDFNKGVQQAEDALKRLASRMSFVVDAAKAAGVALGAAFVASGAVIAMGIKQAIDSADELDELAQKLGTTTEALSRIKYAAEISGVPLDTLTQGVTKLSKALGEIAGGDTESSAARTFQALGVSVLEANGAIRGMDQILIDVADKFASFKDSSEKTALAINLFGKSGAQLIPFLNQGRDGIAELTAEADRLGITLSSTTAAQAGAFNETLDKLSATVQGGLKKAMADLLPSLQSVATYLLENDRAFNMVSGAVTAVVNTIRVLIETYVQLRYVISQATITLRGYWEAASAVANLDFDAANAAWNKMITDQTNNTIQATQAVNSLWAAMNGQPAQGARGASELQGHGQETPAQQGQGGIAPIVASTQALAAAQKLANEEEQRRQQLWNEGLEVTKQYAEPYQLLALEIEKLNRLLNAGVINASTYGKAMSAAAWTAANAYAQSASKIMGNLSSVFGEAKGFAIAQALINTYEAVTAALKGPPGPPWSYAIAASALAAGMAQVANIRSTTKSGGGGSGGASLSSSSASANAASRQASDSSPGLQQGVMINLGGANLFSRETVVGLINEINSAGRDGHKLVTTG